MSNKPKIKDWHTIDWSKIIVGAVNGTTSAPIEKINTYYSDYPETIEIWKKKEDNIGLADIYNEVFNEEFGK
jgi:hypothetical protein